MIKQLLVLLGVLCVSLLTGCTMQQYAHSADHTAYKTLRQGQNEALGKANPFDIYYWPYRPNDKGEIILGKDKFLRLYAGKVQMLSLDNALQISFKNSRAYQTRKEDLFLEALDLANTRRGWDYPLWELPIDSNFDWDKPFDQESTTKNLAVASELGLLQRFVNGGILMVGAGLDMATNFLGSDSLTLGSMLDANFTQPLLRGAWNQLAYEEQYRLERDFLIAVYSFERYRQTFATGIVQDYFSVISLRSRLENEKKNIKRLEQTYKVTKIQADGGQVSRIEADQAEGNLLDAQIRLSSLQQNYSDANDRLKITLGLPTLANIEPDYKQSLGYLMTLKPKNSDIPFTVDEAIDLAMHSRPDVLLERANVRDSERDIEIAANNFLPQLDLAVGYQVRSAPNTKAFYDVRYRDDRQNNRYLSLVFNYNIDQTDNRDDYRATLIELAQARRNYEQFIDEVRLEIRQSYRELQRSRKTYELQVRNVAIAKRRSALASKQQKEGMASARDVLEAEAAYLSAQNGLISAIIDYHTTRLNFLASLGMIQIKEKGLFDVRSDPETFKRIAERYPYQRKTPDGVYTGEQQNNTDQ